MTFNKDVMTTNKHIYKTENYDLFKLISENRPVSKDRISKAMDSIMEIGWRTEPILVNEKMEIIDGQGRFCALCQLGMPIEFVVDEGIGIEECRKLNESHANWTVLQYVDSWAKSGNDNYVWVKQLLSDYRKLPSSLILALATKNKDDFGVRYGKPEMIKKGEVNVSKQERARIENELFYLARYADIAKLLGGRVDPFYSTLVFLCRTNLFDLERLHKVISDNRYELISSGTVEGYISQFEPLYNKGLKKSNKIDMLHEYKYA